MNIRATLMKKIGAPRGDLPLIIGWNSMNNKGIR